MTKLHLGSKIASVSGLAILMVWAVIVGLLDFIGLLFEKYKFARRLLLIWAAALITYSLVSFWQHVDTITDPVAKVIIAVLGLLTVVIGFYQWSRERDES